MGLVLVEVSLEYIEDIVSIKEELHKDGNEFHGCWGLKESNSPEEWVLFLNKFKSKESCPEKYTLSDTYFALNEEDNEVVGVINIRHTLVTEELAEFGGHIGYSIRPKYRGMGYGKEMLRLALEKCSILGINNVLISCEESNIVSEKVILANGGVFEKLVFSSERGKIYKKHWINLGS